MIKPDLDIVPLRQFINAVEFITGIHTRADQEVGFHIVMGATPASFQRDHYQQCWEVIRKQLGYPTEPTVKSIMK